MSVRTRKLVISLALLLAWTCSTSTTGAQQPDGTPSEPLLTVEQLQARAKILREEIARERAALATSQNRRAIELEELRGKRKQLAERALSAQLEKIAADEQLQQLDADEVEAVEASATLAAEAKTVTISVRDACEQLRIHLREVPGSAAAIERLRQQSSQLAVFAESDNVAGELLEDLFGEFDSIHDDATQVRVSDVTLFTADGEQQQVKLLSLGHVRFAYETAGGRVGLALTSPRDATGYRWSEDLDPATQELVREAIRTVEAGDADLVSVPIDPTGRLQPESLTRDGSLVDRFVSGGLVMYPLAALALLALLLIGERFVQFYLCNPNADGRAKQVIAACEAGDFDQALTLCQRGRGAVCRVLAACLRRREAGQRAMEDSIQEQMLQELPKLQRAMRGIATLAAVAPLLGLLGTVTGIIRTFGVIRAFGNANPTLMAGGISEALMTTATGLIIAVPILILLSLLRGRADRITADAERHAAVLLTTLAHGKVAAKQEPQSSTEQRPPTSLPEEVALD